jgi:hypothetical protein
MRGGGWIGEGSLGRPRSGRSVGTMDVDDASVVGIWVWGS